MHEERRGAQRREVRSPHDLSTPGRMQGIGEQEQPAGDSGIIGKHHAGLAAAVGVAASEAPPRGNLSERPDGLTNALAIPRRSGRRWGTLRSRLSKG